MRLEIRMVFDACVQAVNLADMPSRMFVAGGAAFLERDLDEGAAQQNRGQWVFASKNPPPSGAVTKTLAKPRSEWVIRRRGATAGQRVGCAF
jgi:hypothetical protein